MVICYNKFGGVIYEVPPWYIGKLDASSMTNNEYKRPEVDMSRSFFGAHAYYLPTTRFGNYSISAPFIISGPGIKKGIKLNNTLNLTDIAPTLSYLLNIPNPKNSEGRVLYEIIE